MRRIVLLSLLLTFIPLQTNAAPKDDAVTVLNSLAVKGRAAKTGYTRAQFSHWSDLDRNGCDTRNEILNRDLTKVLCTHTMARPYPGDPKHSVVWHTPAFRRDAHILVVAVK